MRITIELTAPNNSRSDYAADIVIDDITCGFGAPKQTKEAAILGAATWLIENVNKLSEIRDRSKQAYTEK